MKRIAKDHFIEEWNDVFYYDKSSPSGLRWKEDRPYGPRKGSVAGYQASNRWKVEYKNKALQPHRVIYYLVNGSIDKNMVVDHIDQNYLNNTFENLRLVESKYNSRNKKKSSANTSDKTGVYLRNEWVATWVENGKNHQKTFKVSEHGEDAKKACF